MQSWHYLSHPRDVIIAPFSKICWNIFQGLNLPSMKLPIVIFARHLNCSIFWKHITFVNRLDNVLFAISFQYLQDQNSRFGNRILRRPTREKDYFCLQCQSWSRKDGLLSHFIQHKSSSSSPPLPITVVMKSATLASAKIMLIWLWLSRGKPFSFEAFEYQIGLISVVILTLKITFYEQLLKITFDT